MVKMGYIKQNIVQHIKENLTGYIIALVFFLIGVSSGCFYYKYVGDFFSDGFGRYMESYLGYIANGSADRWGIFFTSFLSSAETIFFIMLLGLFTFTYPLTELILGGRGFVLGFSASMLLSLLGFDGFLILLLALLPQYLLLLPIYFFCSVLALIRLKKRRQFKGKRGIVREDLGYLQFFICAIVAAIPASLYVTLIMPLIMNGIYSLFSGIL